jgi:hypothetical protein
MQVPPSTGIVPEQFATMCLADDERDVVASNEVELSDSASQCETFNC